MRQEAFSDSLALPINADLYLSWDTEDTMLLGERG